MALPDLSHFRNPDPAHIVLVQNFVLVQISISDPHPDLGRPKRSPKKANKQEISFLEELSKVFKTFPLVTGILALGVYDLCNF
jgi:hypothetical protein